MVKEDGGAFSRLLGNLPEIMNTRIPGLDILDMPVSMPKRFDRLLSFSFRGQTYTTVNGIPKVKARSASRGVLGTFVREGILKQGSKAPFAICGKDFFIYDNAWIMGEVRVGVRVRVTGVVRKGDQRFATKILVLEGSVAEGGEVEGAVNPLN